MTKSFQDQGAVSGCYGCGADNAHGLQIKSFWDGDEAVADYNPQPFHQAGSPDIVYGGLLASLIDCHSVNLAIATAYREENREIGSTPKIFCVTAQLNLKFVSPTPMGATLSLRSTVTKREGRKTWLKTTLSAKGNVCVEGEVLAIRIQK